MSNEHQVPQLPELECIMHIYRMAWGNGVAVFEACLGLRLLISS